MEILWNKIEELRQGTKRPHKVIQIFWIKSKEDLILSSFPYPSDLAKQKVDISFNSL